MIEQSKGQDISYFSAAANVPKNNVMFRFTLSQAGWMSASLLCNMLLRRMRMLRKIMLCCAVLMIITGQAGELVHGEEFGTSRWNSRPAVVPSNRLANRQELSQQVLPYVVRIIAFDSAGQSFGTGSYIGTYGEYGVILTNWHVIFTEETEGLVHVHFPCGFSSFGAVIKSDLTWDLALIAISKPPQSVPMLAISQTPSKPGEPLWIAGYGSGSYRIAEGRCVRYLVPENLTNENPPLYEIMEVSVSARKGDSGGPMLNDKGELAGVLFGSDMVRNTAGSYCERVNRFLMETQSEMAHLPSRPETHFASKEKEGPRHSLRDSRTLTLQNMTPKSPRASDSSSASFDVRSAPRRYIPLEHPVSNQQNPVQQPPMQRQQESVLPSAPFSSRFSMQDSPEQALQEQGGASQGIQAAVWADAAPKVGTSFHSANVVQTAHLTPLESLKPAGIFPVSVTANPPVMQHYFLKLSADQTDLFFVLIMSLNMVIALGLTYYAMRLLARS